MDSPQPTAKTTIGASSSSAATAATTSSSTSPVQESPFSNFISNLSPIGDVKAPHALQGFLGLNSPPLVFTSPRINALRETSFFKRSLCPQLPSAEVSQNEDGGKKIADGPGGLQKSDFLLQGGLIADTHKDSDMKYLVQVQPTSSSGCVDEYLADPVEVDCANSTFAVPNLKQSSNVFQSSHTGITDSKKTMSKFDEKTDMKMKVAVPDAMPREAEQDIRGKSIFDIKPNSIEEEKTCGAWSSNECPNIKSNLSVYHVSCEDSDAQNAGSAHGDESNHPSQYLPEQIVQTYEHSEENAGAIPCGLVDSTMHDPEASQNQRGMSRRCLQFEEARPKTTVNSTNPSSKANNGAASGSPATPAESEGLDSSYVDLSAISSKRQLVNLSQPVTPMFPPRHTGKSPLTVSKPSGIGLHLNSIVNALPKGHGGTVGVKLTGAEYGTLETKASIAVSSMISESFDNIGPLDMLPPIDHHTTPHTKRKFSSEHTDSFEEFGQTSPKKKRKKPSSTIDGDGCKRCNCKKTKCLKLYCDCFAAGIYCADPCACQGCFNRPEYEDTVLETRQQIESRNPLAFAPKIVQHGTELPVNHGDDGNRLTPSSARHKRGCNCKRSMCLKKYCECYQANVGCSSGCRCEGCKNVYGRKEDYVGTEEMVSNRFSKERSQGTLDDKLETVTNNKDFLHTELYDAHNLTPLTPSFQCSDHGKDAPESRILSRRYVPSPESDLTILSSYAKTPGSMKTSGSNDMLLETSKEILDAGSCGQGMDYNSEDMTEQFSSRCDALTDIRHITPLLDFPSTAIASSASSRAGDWTNVSRLQLCPRSGSLSSGSSLLWRSSPATPMTQSGGTKNHQALDSDSRLCDIQEDDTPEILKDASTPIKSVKVSSPSRKRVSPPHGRGHELGSSSSGALKSGRKFILKAVPSFPPLTPCIDSKGNTDQNKSDFQENK